MAKQRRSGLTWVELCVLLGIITLTIALLLPAVQKSREQARKSSSKNNLKQFGLALHNYHDLHRCFPPGGTIREDDVAMHGWVMLIMPFLDQNNLSSKIDYNEPWDSPHNLTVYEILPYAYQIPGVDIHVTSTGYGLTHYLGNPNLLHRNSNVTFDKMKNGDANTWLIGEVAGNYQPWGYPFNWRPLGSKLCDVPASFGHPPWDGGHLLFADGRVSFFSDATAPEILRLLANTFPIATKEQIAVPDHIFQTGDFDWERMDLKSNPQDQNKYQARVLCNSAGIPLLINVYSAANRSPEELAQSKGGHDVFHLLIRIDSSTDIASALKATSLADATSPAQFEANVKLLESFQRQLLEK
ncbi:DUF1559 domain-containing protein [uncultured Gimesia sp.]|uniref:DUF1559 family PulG-like putative transporter n=1 Tax=uncultured Gimesia sp. TaxID=1678688 RepID=UPI0030D7754D|tara:strand:+ start:8968 stop:10035 length:1068 start_codon:yes stop_codon:yes gene_type:complete